MTKVCQPHNWTSRPFTSHQGVEIILTGIIKKKHSYPEKNISSSSSKINQYYIALIILINLAPTTMNEENTNISSKTWFRTIEPINKAGYMNGAAAGQTDSYQSSFNIGYSQGCKIGFELGYNAAIASLHQGNNNDVLLRDPRRINCQLCLNGVMLQEKVDNLYNIQEERNREYLHMA